MNKTQLHLPYGWFIGWPEFLEDCDMPEHAERARGIIERGESLPFTPAELEVLPFFMCEKTNRAELN